MAPGRWAGSGQALTSTWPSVSSDADCSAALAAAFNELPTPYLVDVTHWESLRHEGLRDQIARAGVELQRGRGLLSPISQALSRGAMSHPLGPPASEGLL